MIDCGPSFSASPRSAAILFVFLIALMTGSTLGQNTDPAGRLNLMPLPRSGPLQSGQRVLDSHFHAGFDGSHDARLDAALGRFLERLDRACGGIRRTQAVAGENAPNVLAVKVAGPGGEVQAIDEDESYSVTVTP